MNPIKHALTASLAIFLLLMIPYCIVLVFCVLTNLPLPYGNTFSHGHGMCMYIIGCCLGGYVAVKLWYPKHND
jgi:hypothetical protein